MTPKPPTPQGISVLLKRAGFKHSERQIGGYGNGYVAEKSYAHPETVLVRHRFWSMGGGDHAPWLAKYADAITDAGWVVATDSELPRLIVTAKPGDPSLLAAKDGD